MRPTRESCRGGRNVTVKVAGSATRKLRQLDYIASSWIQTAHWKIMRKNSIRALFSESPGQPPHPGFCHPTPINPYQGRGHRPRGDHRSLSSASLSRFHYCFTGTKDKEDFRGYDWVERHTPLAILSLSCPIVIDKIRSASDGVTDPLCPLSICLPDMCYFGQLVTKHERKKRSVQPLPATRLSLSPRERSVAFRPCLAAGLAFRGCRYMRQMHTKGKGYFRGDKTG